METWIAIVAVAITIIGGLGALVYRNEERWRALVRYWFPNLLLASLLPLGMAGGAAYALVDPRNAGLFAKLCGAIGTTAFLLLMAMGIADWAREE